MSPRWNADVGVDATDAEEVEEVVEVEEGDTDRDVVEEVIMEEP